MKIYFLIIFILNFIFLNCGILEKKFKVNTTNIKDYSNLENLQEFAMNLPQNFKIYFNNYRDNKEQINSYFNQIQNNLKNPFIIYHNFNLILTIIRKNANLGDEGIESFVEFQKFNNCFSNFYAAIANDFNLIISFFKLITLNDTFEHFIQLVTALFEIKGDQIKYCVDYYNHLNNK